MPVSSPTVTTTRSWPLQRGPVLPPERNAARAAEAAALLAGTLTGGTP